MELVKHTPLIYQYNNVVSKEECNNIIEHSKGFDWTQLNSVRSKRRHNRHLPVTLHNYIPEVAFVDNFSHKHIWKIHNQYLDDNPMADYVTNGIDKWKAEYYLRFYDTNDNYDWHVDKGANQSLILSYILYLNDDFIGGNTLIYTEKLKVRPKQGSILVFPCGLQTIHKSTRVTQGKKYIIWCCYENISTIN